MSNTHYNDCTLQVDIEENTEKQPLIANNEQRTSPSTTDNANIAPSVIVKDQDTIEQSTPLVNVNGCDVTNGSGDDIGAKNSETDTTPSSNCDDTQSGSQNDVSSPLSDRYMALDVDNLYVTTGLAQSDDSLSCSHSASVYCYGNQVEYIDDTLNNNEMYVAKYSHSALENETNNTSLEVSNSYIDKNKTQHFNCTPEDLEEYNFGNFDNRHVPNRSNANKGDFRGKNNRSNSVMEGKGNRSKHIINDNFTFNRRNSTGDVQKKT